MGIIFGIIIWVLVGNIWIDMLVRVSRSVKTEHTEFSVFARIINIITWPISIYMFMRGIWLSMEEEEHQDIPNNRIENTEDRTSIGDIQNIDNLDGVDTVEKLEYREWQLKLLKHLAQGATDEQIADAINKISEEDKLNDNDSIE